MQGDRPHKHPKVDRQKNKTVRKRKRKRGGEGTCFGAVDLPGQNIHGMEMGYAGEGQRSRGGCCLL